MARPKTIGLTGKQRELLEMIATWRGPEPPFIGNLAAHLALDESSVRGRLEPLELCGYVERVDVIPGIETRAVPRLLRVTEAGREFLGIGDAPVIIGQLKNLPLEMTMQLWPIPCGQLVEATAEPRYISDISEVLYTYRNGDYLLEAVGNSMVSNRVGTDTIYPGDRVIAHPGVMPNVGDIVHAEFVRADAVHECTLKVWRLDEEKGLVTLEALNPKYPKIVRPADAVLVLGVVKQILPQLRGRK